MILQSLSDPHKQFQLFSRFIQNGDLFLLGGDYDLVDKKTAELFMKFVEEESNKFKLGVVFIGGNHDTYLEQFGHELQTKEWTDKKIYYLNNQTLDLDGLLIHGCPNVAVLSKQAPPEYLAFSKLESEIKTILDNSPIPGDLDILLTHSPLRNILDSGIGSIALTDSFNKLLYKPKIHICGHVHDKFGHELITYEKIDREFDVHHFNVAVGGNSSRGPFLPTIIDYDQNNKCVIAFGQYEMDIT